jgi:hypothetical protein
VHLVGLHLALERDVAPIAVPPLLQRLVGTTTDWPHFAPPVDRGPLTVFHLALAESPADHAKRSREWAEEVWASWKSSHGEIAALAARCFEAGRRPGLACPAADR